jgi:hypothetical protein
MASRLYPSLALFYIAFSSSPHHRPCQGFSHGFVRPGVNLPWLVASKDDTYLSTAVTRRRRTRHPPSYASQKLPMMRGAEEDSSSSSSEHSAQVQEALQSLGDFHQGSWKGKTTSFTVTADVAAGIVQKKTFPEYQVDVKLSYNDDDDGKLCLSEIYSWQDQQDDLFASTRSISIADSSIDIDAVDASYSLHQYGSTSINDKDKEPESQRKQQQQQQYTLPADLIGTTKVAVFTIEHALAVNDDERVRLWALYGEKQELIRIVVAEETRRATTPSIMEGTTASTSLTTTTTTADLLELKTDVDRIVDTIAGQIRMPTVSSTANDVKDNKDTTNNNNNNSNSPAAKKSSEQDRFLQRSQGSWTVSSSSKSAAKNSKDDRAGPPLVRYPMSLLELTSGDWLGDSIIRDFPTVPGQLSSTTAQSSRGKGFGSNTTPPPTISNNNNKPPPFASWAIGVQKVGREWLWDFGDAIRENNMAGKSMGALMEPSMSQSMAGVVCENQSLSRRIPKEERMVYIDWNKDNQVGFLMGSVSMQVCSIAIVAYFIYSMLYVPWPENKCSAFDPFC